MTFSKLLVLCEANICRSPLAEHLIHKLTDLAVDSAGLTASTVTRPTRSTSTWPETSALTCPSTDRSPSPVAPPGHRPGAGHDRRPEAETRRNGTRSFRVR